MPRDAVLIVGGGLLQVPVVVAAMDLGLDTIVSDRDPDAPAAKLATYYLPADTYDEDAHIDWLTQHRADIAKCVAGVFTAGADVEVTVARVASAFNLPGISYTAARTCHEKHRMHTAFDNDNILIAATPMWCTVYDYHHFEQVPLYYHIDYPFIVKPTDNCGSRGVTIVRSPDDLSRAWARAQATHPRCLLVEELLTGSEHSVEILFHAEGRCEWLNIVDRIMDHTNNIPMEIGHLNPSCLKSGQQGQLYELAERAARCIGVTFGAFKIDAMWTKDGPKILECTARLSGGFDCQVSTPLSSGRNFIRAALSLAVGRPVDPADLRPAFHRYCCVRAAFPTPGIVSAIDLKPVHHALGVHHVELRTAHGARVGPYTDCAARPAFVVVVADHPRDALAQAEDAAKLLAAGITTEAIV